MSSRATRITASCSYSCLFLYKAHKVHQPSSETSRDLTVVYLYKCADLVVLTPVSPCVSSCPLKQAEQAWGAAREVVLILRNPNCLLFYMVGGLSPTGSPPTLNTEKHFRLWPSRNGTRYAIYCFLPNLQLHRESSGFRLTIQP